MIYVNYQFLSGFQSKLLSFLFFFSFSLFFSFSQSLFDLQSFLILKFIVCHPKKLQQGYEEDYFSPTFLCSLSQTDSYIQSILFFKCRAIYFHNFHILGMLSQRVVLKTEEKQPRGCSRRKGIRKIHRKTPVPESL